MDLRRVLLAAVLLLPATVLAQDEGLSAPPLPPTTEDPAPEPRRTAPAQAPTKPRAFPPPQAQSESESLPPEPPLESAAEPEGSEDEEQELFSRQVQPHDDSRRPLRLLAEAVGGAAGMTGGALVGFLVGAGIGCAAPGSGSYCGLVGIVGAIPGGFLGLGLGTLAGGSLLGGKGAWWAPMLGGAVGFLASGVVGAGLSSVFYSVPGASTVLSILYGVLPVAGAMLAYELSHGAEVQRSLVPSAVVPVFTSQQRGLALACSRRWASPT